MSVKQHLMAVLLTLAVSIALAGCAGKVKYPAYYTLNVPPAPDPPVQEGIRTSLAVREFRSPRYLRQGPIVYRTSPDELGFYNYHRWAIDPRQFLTSAVADRLRASGTFAQVSIYDGHAADYVLSGSLDKLEEVDYESGGVRVEVAISAQMTQLSTGATVWTNSVSEIGTVAQRNVPSVVSEMNQMVDRAIDKLLTPPPASVIARGN